LARRDFWRRITSLAAQGVTAIVTTHFMEEAEYCDRVAIMDTGRILAQGSPAEIRSRAKPESADERQRKGQPAREPNMEDAFIAIVEDSRQAESRGESEAG
jgi:ABC-2 type transport system ATP-binding protein